MTHALMYQAICNNPACRSKTVIVAEAGEFPEGFVGRALVQLNNDGWTKQTASRDLCPTCSPQRSRNGETPPAG